MRNDAIEIVVTGLALEPAAVRASASLLSDAERERASRFAFPRDARRFIVGRARLRQLLAARLGVRPESVELTYGARGKPALANPGRDSDLHFSLSRRDDIADVMLHEPNVRVIAEQCQGCSRRIEMKVASSRSEQGSAVEYHIQKHAAILGPRGL